MKDANIQYYIFYVVIVTSLLLGLYRFKSMDKASKVFVVLLSITVLCELSAYYGSVKYHNNMPIYAIYSIVEFFMISIYFNQVIDVFRKQNIGYYIAMAGVILGVFNLIFFQGIYTLNSYFLIFEGICIIGMSLFSFFRLLLVNDQLKLYRYPHFWFATILAFFWSVTFLNWTLYDYLLIHFNSITWIVNLSIVIVNLVTYSAISCVFILYPKMQKTYER